MKDCIGINAFCNECGKKHDINYISNLPRNDAVNFLNSIQQDNESVIRCSSCGSNDISFQ